MRRILVLLSLVALNFTSAPFAFAVAEIPTTPSCGELHAMRRHEIEMGFETAQSEAKVLAEQKNDSALSAGITSAEVAQGFESKPAEGIVLKSFVAKTDGKTLVIQNAYSDDADSRTLGVRVLQVTDRGDLKPRTEELQSSGVFEPEHAPRGRCVRYNWSCVEDGCGLAALPCGAASGAAYFACLGIACVFVLGVCCEKWEVNPYD